MVAQRLHDNTTGRCSPPQRQRHSLAGRTNRSAKMLLPPLLLADGPSSAWRPCARPHNPTSTPLRLDPSTTHGRRPSAWTAVRPMLGAPVPDPSTHGHRPWATLHPLPPSLPSPTSSLPACRGLVDSRDQPVLDAAFLRTNGRCRRSGPAGPEIACDFSNCRTSGDRGGLSGPACPESGRAFFPPLRARGTFGTSWSRNCVCMAEHGGGLSEPAGPETGCAPFHP